MAKNMKVTIKQAAWGNVVMAGPEMRAYLASLAGQVAGKLPGATVDVSTSRTVRGGGRRARATISTTIPMSDEADSGQALAALRSVVGSAHVPKNSRAAVARATKREERRR